MTSCFSSDLIHIENSAGDEQTKKKKKISKWTQENASVIQKQRKNTYRHTLIINLWGALDLIWFSTTLFITEKEKKQKHNLIMKLKPIKATSFKKYVKLVINNSNKYGDGKTVLRSWADK